MPAISRPIKPQWLQILLALSDHDLHGFGIRNVVLENTDGHMRLWPAMLYRSLNRLEGARLIKQVPPPRTEPEDERRQYYALTSDGRVRLEEEVAMLARWVEAARTARPA